MGLHALFATLALVFAVAAPNAAASTGGRRGPFDNFRVSASASSASNSISASFGLSLSGSSGGARGRGASVSVTFGQENEPVVPGAAPTPPPPHPIYDNHQSGSVGGPLTTPEENEQRPVPKGAITTQQFLDEPFQNTRKATAYLSDRIRGLIFKRAMTDLEGDRIVTELKPILPSWQPIPATDIRMNSRPWYEPKMVLLRET